MSVRRLSAATPLDTFQDLGSAPSLQLGVLLVGALKCQLRNLLRRSHLLLDGICRGPRASPAWGGSALRWITMGEACLRVSGGIRNFWSALGPGAFGSRDPDWNGYSFIVHDFAVGGNADRRLLASRLIEVSKGALSRCVKPVRS